jgi:hypothetical protein
VGHTSWSVAGSRWPAITFLLCGIEKVKYASVVRQETAAQHIKADRHPLLLFSPSPQHPLLSQIST